MLNSQFYPRPIERRLVEALQDSPAVLIHGPRQSGKTTLAQYTCAPDNLTWLDDSLVSHGESSFFTHSHKQRDYSYFSFDDPVVCEAARADPMEFVRGLPEHTILDEVQHVPEIFRAIKIEVDRRRTAGRFLLTGSTNLFLVPQLSESLAGRLQVVNLHPLSRYEIETFNSDGKSTFLKSLFGDGFPVKGTKRLGESLMEIITTGGFPPALELPTARRRANWYRAYMDGIIQRDVREMAQIRSADILPRLLSAAASQTARIYNLSSLASPFQVSRPTVEDYILLLERLFLLQRLPPWHSNRLNRLVKSPKLHIGDTGLAAALLGVDARSLAKDRKFLGQLLETFIFLELQKQAGWHDAPISFHHFRDRDGVEVDLVLEQGAGAIAGVEVKAASRVTEADFRGLRKLAAVFGESFQRGIVLYDGEVSAPFGERMQAVPIRRLWEAH